MPEEDLYEQLIAAADAIYGGPRDGVRALHAKGAWCEGTFTASPEAGELSRAFIFSGEPIGALIRFSNGPGDPEAARLRARSTGPRGQAAWLGRRGARHPLDHLASVSHPHA